MNLRELIEHAFRAGYDAGWSDSSEGHNCEYTSESFTDERYEKQFAEALTRWRESNGEIAIINGQGSGENK